MEMNKKTETNRNTSMEKGPSSTNPNKTPRLLCHPSALGKKSLMKNENQLYAKAKPTEPNRNKQPSAPILAKQKKHNSHSPLRLFVPEAIQKPETNECF